MRKSHPTLPLGAPDQDSGGRDGSGPGEAARMRTVPVSGDGGAPAGQTDALGDGDNHRESFDPDNADRLLGRIIAGRYEVKRVLGRGGMGIVYEGKHITVGRGVAIKVLRHDLARQTDAVQRFHREAKAAATIGSEHIVEVFDFGYSDEGHAYIAMELLVGEDLGRLVRREGPLVETRAVAIARQVARALESAHSKGIIHRDLKSENIFIIPREGAEFIKLLDFGISKVSEGDEGRGPVTTEGVVMGTPHYMAPEQAMSAFEADHRIDIYALGCLMYEMLTGHVPFSGRNPVEVVFKHVHEAPVALSKIRPGISPELEAVVLKALAKNRDHRYASANEMLVALSAWRTSNTPDLRDSRVNTPSAPMIVALDRTLTPAVPQARGRTRLGLLAAFGGAAIGIGAVAVLRLAQASHEVRDTRRAIVPVAHDAGLSPARVTGPSVVPSIAVAQPQAPVDAGAARTETALEIIVRPPTATILIDGIDVGHGHARGSYLLGSAHRVRLAAPGFAPLEVSVIANGAPLAPFSLQPSGSLGARVTRAGNAVVVPAGIRDAGAPAGRAAEPAGSSPGTTPTSTPYGDRRVDDTHPLHDFGEQNDLHPAP